MVKIWYQGFLKFGQEDTIVAYRNSLVKHFSKVVDPGVEVTIHGIKRGIHEARDFRIFLSIDSWQIVQNIITAEQEGYDAFALGNMLDPGLDDGREAVNIPVLGLCETSLLYASTLAPKFSLIYPDVKWGSMVWDRVVKYGFQDKIASKRFVPLPIPLVSKAFTDAKSNELCMQQLKEEIRKVIANGAEVIVPCSGELMTLLAHNNIYEIDGIPILNGVSVLIKWAEMAVKLKKITGVCVSRGATYGSAPKEVLKKMKEVYGPWNP